jgi:hypothetical protein
MRRIVATGGHPSPAGDTKRPYADLRLREGYRRCHLNGVHNIGTCVTTIIRWDFA